MSVTVVGSINIDAVLRVDRLPRPGETVVGHSISYHPGGKGANQAVAAARFGARTRLIGAVGDDEHGSALRRFLVECHVDVGDVATHRGATGLAQICVAASGENQIVVVAGANATVSAAEHWTPPPEGRPVLLAQLELPIAEIAVMLRRARALGVLTVLNTAPALADARPLFDDVDVLVLNETELGFYLDCDLPVEPERIGRAARALRRRADQRIVVTLGAAGMVASDGDRILALPAPRVTVVDTVGAGDCFCGVLAGALAEEIEFASALSLAGRAASLSVQRQGAAAAMPLRGEIEAAEGSEGSKGAGAA